MLNLSDIARVETNLLTRHYVVFKNLTITVTKKLSSTFQIPAILSSQSNKRGQWEKQTIGKEEEFTRGSTELGVYVSVLNEPIWLVRNFGFKLSNLMFALSRKSQPRGGLGELVSSV